MNGDFLPRCHIICIAFVFLEVIDLTCPTDESFVDLTSANESSFVVSWAF